jgi:acyl-CoA thioesterase
MSEAMHPFDADTALTAIGANRFAATVSERWSLVAGHANGGYALGICMRALATSSAYPDPLVTSANYLRRVVPGPAELVVEQVRVGRRLWVGQTSLVQDGKEKVRVIANFGDLAAAAASSGPSDVRNTAPALPPVEDCVAVTERETPAAFQLARRLEYRYPRLPGWRTGSPGGVLTEEFWMRFAPEPVERHADTLALCSLVDMAAPPVMDLGEYNSTTIELTVHVRGIPAPGWLACRVSTRHLIDGYHDEDFELWDTDGRLVAQSRQLALLPTRRPTE